MSRVISGKTKPVRPRAQPIPRCVGREVSRTKWRCPDCTFLNEGDACSMCGSSRPAQARPNLIVHPSNKPSKAFPRREEAKKPLVTVHDDRTDNSVNVPEAGIKKYKYDPRRLPSNAEQQKRRNDGMRDLLGDLQAAASDKPMPCMRNNKK